MQLGRWTMGQGKEKPTWGKHLHTNPRHYMKESIRYLKANPGASGPTLPSPAGI